MRSMIRPPGYAWLPTALAAATLGWAALSPATAEDSGFWEVVRANGGLRPLAPAPGVSVVLPPALAPLRPQILRLPPAPGATAKAVPPDPAKRENPLVALLNDSTLRYGDIVVFPDGARVFRGEAGGRHSPHDFVALSAAREVPPTTRKMVLAMPVGENSAWSSQTNGVRGRLAQRTPDVTTTGSIGASGGKTVTVRTGRGDVRVISFP
jgi:hypothetical protein